MTGERVKISKALLERKALWTDIELEKLLLILRCSWRWCHRCSRRRAGLRSRLSPRSRESHTGWRSNRSGCDGILLPALGAAVLKPANLQQGHSQWWMRLAVGLQWLQAHNRICVALHITSLQKWGSLQEVMSSRYSYGLQFWWKSALVETRISFWPWMEVFTLRASEEVSPTAARVAKLDASKTASMMRMFFFMVCSFWSGAGSSARFVCALFLSTSVW